VGFVDRRPSGSPSRSRTNSAMAYEWRWPVGIGASDPSEIRRGLTRNFRSSPAVSPARGRGPVRPTPRRAPRANPAVTARWNPSETGDVSPCCGFSRLVHAKPTNRRVWSVHEPVRAFFPSEPLFTRECVTSADFVRAFAGVFELPTHGVEYAEGRGFSRSLSPAEHCNFGFVTN
jgi:hypothetical protein